MLGFKHRHILGMAGFVFLNEKLYVNYRSFRLAALDILDKLQYILIPNGLEH